MGSSGGDHGSAVILEAVIDLTQWWVLVMGNNFSGICYSCPCGDLHDFTVPTWYSDREIQKAPDGTLDLPSLPSELNGSNGQV